MRVPEPPQQDELQRCADCLIGLAEVARGSDLTIAVEPLNRFEAYLLNTAEQANAMMAAVGRPEIAILYDTFHAHIEEKDPIAALHGVHSAGHLGHVNISETDRGTPVEGHAKIRETISALKHLGYDGWLTIEAFGKAVPELATATRVWRDFFRIRGRSILRVIATFANAGSQPRPLGRGHNWGHLLPEAPSYSTIFNTLIH